MMKSAAVVIDKISIALIYVFSFILPLVFTNLTTEYYDSAKFFLLCGLSLILLLLLGIKFLATGQLELKRTPIDIFLILFWVAALLSTIFSPSKYTALFGLAPNLHGGLIYITALVLFYFMLTANIKNLRQITNVTNLMIAAGVILAVALLLTYFKVRTGIPLVGSLQASVIYLCLILPLTLRLLTTQPWGALVSLLFGITIVLIGNLPAGILALVALVLTAVTQREYLNKIMPSLVVLVVLCLVLGLLSSYPKLKDKTPLGKVAANFQREVSLPFDLSWKISASAFRDSPLLGSGPNTFLYDFTQYKPLEINQTPFWNVRFGNAHDFYLQTWAELGGVGIAAMLGLAISVFIFTLKNRHQNGLTNAGLIFILALALSPMTTLVETAGMMILAVAFLASEKTKDYQVELGSNAVLVSASVFLPILLLVAGGGYFVSKVAIADYFHRQALDATTKNQAIPVYNHLVKAEQINPFIDLYRTDLAQTNFALANAIASAKGPTETSPGGSLTSDDKRNIQQLLSQAIAEGRTAVSISPKSAGNWEILAQLYRQISGVATNGLQFSLDAYGRAISLDPLNPVLRLAVGGVYYQLKNYDLAIRFFDDAVSLKPNYANALYNLAIALRDKGSFQEAILIAEKLVTIVSKDTSSKEYQIAPELLTQLKEKSPSKAQPTTATPSASLENKNLPKVLDLPQPGEIATPPAVKK